MIDLSSCDMHTRIVTEFVSQNSKTYDLSQQGCRVGVCRSPTDSEQHEVRNAREGEYCSPDQYCIHRLRLNPGLLSVKFLCCSSGWTTDTSVEMSTALATSLATTNYSPVLTKSTAQHAPDLNRQQRRLPFWRIHIQRCHLPSRTCLDGSVP